jgi:hypothetical protein
MSSLYCAGHERLARRTSAFSLITTVIFSPPRPHRFRVGVPATSTLTAREGCILRRLAGEIGGAEELLDSVNTTDTAIVGTNWSMWLEDERCAIAIVRENPSGAQRHLERARALARAYGQHRLALADLEIRGLQLDVLLGAELREIVQRAQDCRRRARRAAVLTPLRRAWVDGVVADCARRAGDHSVANAKHALLLQSPHLVHRLAAGVGLLIHDRDPKVDVDALEQAIGPTVMGQMCQALLHPNLSRTHVTNDVLTGLRDGRHFLYLS